MTACLASCRRSFVPAAAHHNCPCSGEAAVTQGGKVVNRLFKADYFGERALLSNEPRGATVVAQQETVCLVLDRDTFLEILGPLDKAMAVCGAPCLFGDAVPAWQNACGLGAHSSACFQHNCTLTVPCAVLS